MSSIVDEIERLKRRIDNLQSDVAYSYVTAFMSLPGLRCFWPLGPYRRTAGGSFMTDIANNFDLTVNAAAQINYTNTAPYTSFNGTTQFLSYADDPQFDITGTEANSTSINGMTFGGWFYFNAAIGGTSQGLMTKDDTSTGRSYSLFRLATSGLSRLVISTDGSATVAVSSTATAPSAQTWTYIVGRFNPSTELAIFQDNTKTVNLSSIPASIFNSGTDFNIGAFNSASLFFPGRASLCFLSAVYLSDEIIYSLYQSTRGLFRV